jgi:hypothetical protein
MSSKQAQEMKAPGRAWGLGGYVQDILRPHLLGKPIPAEYLQKWYKELTPPESIAADPAALRVYREQVLPLATTQIREQQARAWGNIANLLMGGALAGAGYGLGRQLPKLLALRDIPKVEKRKKRKKEAQVEALGRAWRGLMRGGREKLFPLPTRPLDVPMGTSGLLGRPGINWLLYPAAGIIPAHITYKLLDWATDVARSRKVRKRREALREQFQSLLADQDRSELGDSLDKASEIYGEKSAAIGPAALGGAMLYALLSGLAGYHAGAGIRRKVDPKRMRMEALRRALHLKRIKRPVTLEMTPVSPEEAVEEPEVLPPAAGGLTLPPAQMVMPIPEKKKKEKDTGEQPEYEEALDLLKMSQWYQRLNPFSEQYIPRQAAMRGKQWLGQQARDIAQPTIRAAQTAATQAMQPAMQAVQTYGPEIGALREQLASGQKEIAGLKTRLGEVTDPEYIKRMAGMAAEQIPGGVVRGMGRGLREKLGPAGEYVFGGGREMWSALVNLMKMLFGGAQQYIPGMRQYLPGGYGGGGTMGGAPAAMRRYTQR